MLIVSTNISVSYTMAETAPTVLAEDLEDGEIESEGEEATENVVTGKSDECNINDEENQDIHKEEQQQFYYSKSGKKKKSKSHKGEQKFKDKSKKNRKYTNPLDDDFAGNIEKAIRKAMNKNEDIQGEVENEAEERRKYKKRKKYDNKDGPGRKRKKQEYSDEMDESEMMCVRGASPVHKNSPGEAYQENDSSYASDSSQESRGPPQHRPQRQRPPQRERNKNNKNDRRRGTHPMQDPEGVCLYYMQGKCQKGDECLFSHDVQPPRKMELCKFYLMDCCAKRDKCLYMHADFPCKYYHTGLPCIYKDECKFAHGKPLNDSLKNILLKHIESAPKEILGDFPRLNREGALKLIQNTQLKLMQQFSENTESQERSIPSLFELNIPIPQNSPDSFQMHQYNNERQKVSPKIRQSRWQNEGSNPNFGMNLSPNGNTSSSNILNIKNLTGVLTPKQISDLTKMGIENLDQLGQLTVLQLNSIGISLKQITEIQLNTMSIQKLGLINNVDQQAQAFIGSNAGAQDMDLRVPPVVQVSSNASLSTDLPGQDIDMRFQPSVSLQKTEEIADTREGKSVEQNKDMIDIDQYTKDALKFALKDKENIDISNESFENEKPVPSIESKDVDHRVLPFANDDPRMRHAKIEDKPRQADTDIRFLQPEPIFKNTEKRHRRSTTDDEDNNLLIDEKWYSSDEEKGSKKKSPASSPKTLMSPPAPHIIEPSTVISRLGDLSKIDISEEVTKLLNTMKNNTQDNKQSTAEVSEPRISRDPRSRRSPDRVSDSGKTGKKSPRVSIYECIDGEPTDGRRRTDVDLRQADYKVPTFGDTDLRQSADGDIDFRLGLPFKAIPNYTPASEINGSINSHPPISYKLVTIDIPRPDYTDIRNSTAKSQALQDPRLRKVFRLSVDESNSDSEKPPKVTSTAPRVDPRRKPKEPEIVLEQKTASIDLQTILQNSNWYKDLSSTQKIFVNQHLVPVTQMIKQYQQDKSSGKKFDISSVQSNTVLCNIFTNLGVSLEENGEYSYLPKPKEALLKTPVNFNQGSMPFNMNSAGGMEPNMSMMSVPPMGMGAVSNMNNLNVGHMHNFNQPLSDPRGGPAPGLLGIAPNIPHNFNNNFGGPNNYGNNMSFNGPPQGNDFNYMDGDQNFQRFPNRGGHRGRGNDRWNRGGSGRGHRDRKNYNDRGNWKHDRH
ncbi:PREDICTED: protein suppressor of sable isoform X1 [Papilio polytes]|uniref:protein suppressor of sable isoform X1 n=2 Tax=Papilio polytes TaxID=76194 RepID=UPI000675F75B|nr:PREDICTED: protein suppressor of sable isoform X1 [Papilio polytes]